MILDSSYDASGLLADEMKDERLALFMSVWLVHLVFIGVRVDRLIV